MTDRAKSLDDYWIRLDVFEGPLDLLLHIIKKHEIDILDIPVAFVLDRYLECLAAMKEMQLDIAAEYLSMAATLVYIKSKMMLPGGGDDDEDEEEEAEDPRAALVRRLLEYKKYREAAAALASRSALGCEVFEGGFEPEPEEREIVADVGLFDLVERVAELIKEARERGNRDHDLFADRITVAARIQELAEHVARRPRTTFRELLPAEFDVFDVVVTFLAVLEMAKLRMIRVVQATEDDGIVVMEAPRYEEDGPGSGEPEGDGPDPDAGQTEEAWEEVPGEEDPGGDEEADDGRQ